MHRLPLYLFLCWFILGSLACGDNRHGLGVGPIRTTKAKTETILQGELLVDTSGRLTLSEAMRSPNWAEPDSSFIQLKDYAVWVRFELNNDTPVSEQRFLRLNRYIDTVRLFSVSTLSGPAYEDAPQSIEELNGHLFHPRANYTILLKPGERQTIYARYGLTDEWNQQSISRARIRPEADFMRERIGHLLWFSLYVGIMLIISALSLFTYALFRDRSFAYFGLLTLSMAFYTIATEGLFGIAGISTYPLSSLDLTMLAIMATIMFGTLFIVTYADIRRMGPWLYRVCLGLMVLAVLTQFIPRSLDIAIFYVMFLANLSILVWLVGLVGIVIFLAFVRGSSSAKRIVLAAILMIIPTVIYVYQLIFNRNSSLDAKIGFNIGSVLFSVLLFLSLYAHVNRIRLKSRQLQDQDQLKRKFFANISHEFRTPLTVIIGALEQLRRRIRGAGTPDAVVDELVQLAGQNASRQLQLVDQILELARSDASLDLTIDPQRIHLATVVEDAVVSLTPMSERKEIVLSFDPGSNPDLPAYLDGRLIHDALTNVISNAVKYTDPGGRVDVRLRHAEGRAVIMVSDTGRGIEPELLAKIFDRFTRGEQEDPATPSTGIGLHLVKQYVEAHHGTVTVESTSGRGTTVTIVLPMTAVDMAAARATEPATVTTTEAPRPHLLIVEDSADLRRLLGLILGEDYHLSFAENGREGLERCRANHPDLIVSDVMMPEMDGYELVRALKSDLETNHIPIILLTALGSQRSRNDGLKDGADDYLTKPFDEHELRLRIRNILEQRRRLRQRFTEIEPTDTAPEPSTPESAFLNEAEAIVDHHLDDDDFRVADFARAIGLSQASLNRKLRGLAGVSTNQFIRLIRLRRAAEMLKTTDLSVSEIAARTGFGSSAYFAKAFKDEYGTNPKHFAEQGS